MLDYCLYKYLNFFWKKFKWYRKSIVFSAFKFYRINNNCIINLYLHYQKFFHIQPLLVYKKFSYKKTVFLRTVRILLLKYGIYKLLNLYYYTYLKFYMLLYIKKFIKNVGVTFNIILLSGRFSRRDRATYYWRLKGKLPFNSVTAKVDYNMLTVRLKNSLCGIKVWLCLRSRFRKLFIF